MTQRGSAMTETTRGRRADSSVISHIYVLTEPGSNNVRYVGKTAKKLEVRLRQHITHAKAGFIGHRDSWIRKLLAEGLLPEIQSVEQGYWDPSEADLREIRWIESFRFLGEDLTNMTNGGDGNRGSVVLTDEARSRISETSQRMWDDPESRERLLATRKAAWDRDRETRSSELAEITRKRWADPDAPARKTLASAEYRARRSAIAKKNSQTDEGKKHLSNNGAKSSRLRRQCNDCGLVTSPAPMGAHLKGSKHSGFTDIKLEGGE